MIPEQPTAPDIYPIDRHFSNLSDVIEYFKIGNASAVREAYDVYRERFGPFVVRIATRMLPRLHQLADQGYVIASLSRDGDIYETAWRGLAPDRASAHCRRLAYSRLDGATMLADLKTNHGRNLADFEKFSRNEYDVPPANIAGAYARTTAYARAQGVPLGLPGSKVAILDMGFSGSIQEMWAAAFPETTFQGVYAFYGASRADPHPGTKRGYYANFPVGSLPGDRPLTELPDAPELMFACNWGFPVLEFTLNGPLTSANHAAKNTPVQHFRSGDPADFKVLNPLLVDARLKEPGVLSAVKTAAFLAVFDHARETARKQAAGMDWQGELDRASTAFLHDAFQWFRFGRTDDERLQWLLDTLVVRNDAELIECLHDDLARRNVSAEEASALWRRLADASSLAEKTSVVAEAKAGWVNKGGIAMRTATQGFAPAHQSPAKSAEIAFSLPRVGTEPIAPPNRASVDLQPRASVPDKGMQKAARLRP